MSVPQFFGMLNELRNSAQLHEATASAELAAETTGDATATQQIESLANQCQFQAERLVALDAENAELRKQCAAFHAEANDHYLASLAANATLDRLRDLLPEGGVWCYACNRATVPIWGEEPYRHIDPKYKQMKTTFRCSICKRETHAKDSCVDTLRDILYPTPENDND